MATIVKNSYDCPIYKPLSNGGCNLLNHYFNLQLCSSSLPCLYPCQLAYKMQINKWHYKKSQVLMLSYKKTYWVYYPSLNISIEGCLPSIGYYIYFHYWTHTVESKTNHPLRKETLRKWGHFKRENPILKIGSLNRKYVDKQYKNFFKSYCGYRTHAIKWRSLYSKIIFWALRLLHKKRIKYSF